MPTDVRRLAEQWFNKMNIQKAPDGVIDLANTNFGGIMPIPVVEQMITWSREQSAWLKNIASWPRSRTKGEVPLIGISGNISEGVGPNEGTKITKRPSTAMVSYQTKKFRSDYDIPYETLREFQNTPELGDFEAQIAKQFAIAWGNDRANVIMNGDTSLDDSTSLNRLLRMIDGAQKQLATANVYDAEGKAWGQGIWRVMQAYMPEKYRQDPNLNWMYNDLIDILWHGSLTNTNTTERMRSGLGDQVISTPVKVPPLGKPQLIIPQLSATQGETPTAPTDATDNDDGTITFRVATILADATDSSGRIVKVTHKASGNSELCTVDYNGSSQNVITTAGSLGQDTISETASDYLVTEADETNILYGNPKGIVEVVLNEVRSYREYNKDFDRFEITSFWEMDVIVPLTEIFVNFQRILAPVPTTW